MRFLINEKSYETPLASGVLRYEKDGQPTGTIESWRLTRTATGEEILRVDLDVRANDGGSFLYHLLLDADGTAQRLTYRFLGKENFALSGNVLFGDDGIINSRKIASIYRDEEVTTLPFFFPSTIGLGWLTRQQVTANAVTLDMHAEVASADFLALKTITPIFTPQRTRDIKLIPIRGKPHPATILTIAWADQSRTLWLTPGERWPLKMQRADGLVAIETRLVRYQQSLAKRSRS